MVSRASKYTLFFLALVFVTCAIFELTAKVRLHAVQYALLGASVVLFPLLLLAIGEPLGFGAAYAISAAAVAAQASLYTAAATGRARLGLILAGVLAALFAFLHVVLRLEAYALLAGTLALFTALSIVMVVTRRVRWGA
jgi:inner membrane protein